MTYRSVQKAVFRLRPNRFVAECSLDGELVRAHVPNTGRCRELLVPGCTAYLEDARAPGGPPRPARKTRYTLVAVEKGGRLINLDSQAPNRVFREAAESGKLLLPGMEGPCTLVRPEVRYGDSRFDFYLEGAGGAKRAYAEIKGVTLEEEGAVFFPDAPTERGVKHLNGLCRAAAEGYLAYLVFVVQMRGVRCLSPNRRTHPAFAEAMERARDAGVALLARDCLVEPARLELGDPVPVVL